MSVQGRGGGQAGREHVFDILSGDQSVECTDTLCVGSKENCLGFQQTPSLGISFIF